MLGINEKIIETLEHLIAIANGGKYGYEKAALDIKDTVLKQMFMQYSLERAGYVDELKREVTRLGGSSHTGSGPLGALHRTWMDIKSVITSGERKTILKTCITGEEAALKAYTEALRDKNIPENIKPMISQQLSAIQFALNSIRSLAATTNA